MASFNRVILMGNLTRDPELKTSPSGNKVAVLRLAVSETWRDKNTGGTREIVCYVDVVVWNRQAETCAQYLKKGSPVLVEGRLQMDEWTSPQGEKRSRLRVRADAVKFIGFGAKRSTPDEACQPVSGDQPRPPAGGPRPPAPPPVEPSLPSASDLAAQDDEDLPF